MTQREPGNRMNEAGGYLHAAVRRLNCAGCVLALFVGAYAAAQSKPHSTSAESQVIVAENAFQRSESTGNLVALRSMLTPDFVQVDNDIISRDQLFDRIQRMHSLPCHFGISTVDHSVVTLLGPDIATIAYHSMQNATCFGHVLQAEGNISSVWIKANGQWKVRLHSEIVTGADAK